MRNLSMVAVALVVVLGIVSGNLWRELRSDRQLIADLQDQLAQARRPVVGSPPVPAPQRTIEARAPSPPAAPRSEPQPAPVGAAPAPASPAPVVQASVRQPLTTGTEAERRAIALAQSDRTATARVAAWSGGLTAQGRALSPEQLQALNAAAIAELRRETEESLDIDSRAGPMDALAMARLKEETITRQHDTNVRILDRVTPQLTAAQVDTLRTMFEAWAAPRLAAARAERERTARPGK